MRTNDHAPRGIPGKWAVLALLVVTVLGVTLGILLIHPAPGDKPAPVYDRPFGPTTHGDRADVPLIYKSANDQ